MTKVILLTAAVALFFLFYTSGGERWLLPETYQSLYASKPWATAGIYFAVYVLVAALSIPGAALMTLIAGAVFGLATGTLLVSFASSIGATLAFLISRGLIRDWVESRFSAYLGRINQGVEKDGAYYLFGLRLIPVFPFFVINLVMGLTSMRPGAFYLVSQIGMLPATLVYVNAGAQVGTIDELSLSGILTPGLFASFALLGIFPFIAKRIADFVQRQRVYKDWNHLKPGSFDTNLIVIGAGSAGLVSAYIAATVNAKVSLIEKEKMGGDCLNTGCVPSKALIRSAKIRDYMARASGFGIIGEYQAVDFKAVMARVQNVIADIEPHDSVERYTGLGVDCIAGEAEIISPWQVRVGEQRISAPNIILATGAGPLVPKIPGLSDLDYLTSDNLWSLAELPGQMLVLGAGPIGCEMAQAFSSLGSKVTLVDMAPEVLPREDRDVSELMLKQFEDQGIRVLCGHKTIGFRLSDTPNRGAGTATLESAGGTSEVEFDRVLVAVGRAARVNSPGFDTLGLEVNAQGRLDVDEYMRTKYPNVFACGDLTGPYQFTHVAAHQAWYASVNALFGRLKKFKVDDSVIPWATFTNPEVAQVGINELTAREQNIAYEVTRYPLDDLDRAIADSEVKGFVKVLTVPGKDRILGATIVGYQAGNLIAEFVLAMKHGLGLNKILGTIHIYPTMAEANKYAAGEWKKARVTDRTKKWLARYHSWFR